MTILAWTSRPRCSLSPAGMCHLPGGYWVTKRDLNLLRELSRGTFNAVLSTGRSFTHMTRDEEIQVCLRGVVALLHPGGVFACDCIDGNKIPPDPVRRVTENTKVCTRVFRRDFTHSLLPGTGKTLDSTIHWQIQDQDKLIAEFDDGARHRAFLPGEMGQIL